MAVPCSVNKEVTLTSSFLVSAEEFTALRFMWMGLSVSFAPCVRDRIIKG